MTSNAPLTPTERETAHVSRMFQRAWWVIAARGVLGVLLGIATLSWPQVTSKLLLSIIGAYLFLDGVLAFVATFRAANDGRSWGPYLFEGAFGVGVGLLAFARPTSFIFAIVLLVGGRAMIAGFAELRAAAALRRARGKALWGLVLAGVVSIAFGVLMVVHPSFGLAALVWLFGLQMLAFGSFLIAAAFGVKAHRRPLAHGAR